MVYRTMPFRVTSYAVSDIGRVRDENQDAWMGLEKEHFFAIADGMGGHNGGRVAAEETLRHLSFLIKEKYASNSLSLDDGEEMELFLSDAIQEVNKAIYWMGQHDARLEGMGCTLCCVLFLNKQLVIGHVGDSRIYCLRRGCLVQLTKDHSLLRELIDMGQLNEQGAREFNLKNIITKAIGIADEVHPAMNSIQVDEGDLFLLCSDGLSDLISPEQIEECLKADCSLEEQGKQLVEMANEAGGKDNITVLLLKAEEEI
ncbi:MAG: serine/threonine protein phosphatase [Waddliaceae bacterium]|nr:serine/threonine protein phosphatase [Waddliaceae bacterium]